MASFPLKLVGCLPNLDSFCGVTLEWGASCALLMYSFLPLPCILVPVIALQYHHQAKPLFLVYLQWVFVYPGALSSAIVACMALLVCGCARKRGLYCMQCSIRENPLTPYVLLLCLIMSICFTAWGVLAFIRAFIDPGIVVFDNRKVNPYAKEVCEKGSKGSKICRAAGEEQQRKAKQWDLDHANDPITQYGSKTVDACFSLIFTLCHLYGFYPLLALKAFLSKEEDEEEA